MYVILPLKQCGDWQWQADCSQHLQGLEQADVVSKEEGNLLRVADCYIPNTMAISNSSLTSAIQTNGKLRYLNDEEENIFSARGELSEDEEEWRELYHDRFNLSNVIYDVVKTAMVRKQYIKYCRKVTKVDINFMCTYYI